MEHEPSIERIDFRDIDDPVLTDQWQGRFHGVVWILAAFTVGLCWIGLDRALGGVEALLMAMLAGIVHVVCWSFLLSVAGKPASRGVQKMQGRLALCAGLSTGMLCSTFGWYALARLPATLLHMAQTVEIQQQDLRRLSDKVVAEAQAIPVVRDGAVQLNAQGVREAEFGGTSGKPTRGAVYNQLMREAGRFESAAKILEDSAKDSERRLEEVRLLVAKERGLLADSLSGTTDMDMDEVRRAFAGLAMEIDESFRRLGAPVLPTALRLIEGDSAPTSTGSGKSGVSAETQAAAMAQVQAMAGEARRRAQKLAGEARAVRTRSCEMLTDEMLLIRTLPLLPMYLAAPLIADVGVPLIMMLVMVMLRAGQRREAAEQEAARVAAERRSRLAEAHEVHAPDLAPVIKSANRLSAKGGANGSPLVRALRAAQSAARD